jgi:hypothetical protein
MELLLLKASEAIARVLYNQLELISVSTGIEMCVLCECVNIQIPVPAKKKRAPAKKKDVVVGENVCEKEVSEGDVLVSPVLDKKKRAPAKKKDVVVCEKVCEKEGDVLVSPVLDKKKRAPAKKKVLVVGEKVCEKVCEKEGSEGNLLVPPEKEGSEGNLLVPPEKEGSDVSVLVPPEKDVSDVSVLVPPESESTPEVKAIPNKEEKKAEEKKAKEVKKAEEKKAKEEKKAEEKKAKEVKKAEEKKSEKAKKKDTKKVLVVAEKVGENEGNLLVPPVDDDESCSGNTVLMPRSPEGSPEKEGSEGNLLVPPEKAKKKETKKVLVVEGSVGNHPPGRINVEEIMLGSTPFLVSENKVAYLKSSRQPVGVYDVTSNTIQTGSYEEDAEENSGDECPVLSDMSDSDSE